MQCAKLAGGCVLVVGLFLAGCESQRGGGSVEGYRADEVVQAEPVSFTSDRAVRTPSSTEDLIAFVNRAAERLRFKGDQAFAEFGRKGSEWNHDDVYLFVFDAESHKAVFHGVDPRLVGTDLADITGAEGRALGEWGLHGLSGDSKRVWLFYKWPRPTGGLPGWKVTYMVPVRTDSGENYLLGSGAYDLSIDRRLVTEMVDMAVEWIARDGQEALDFIRQPKGPFVYKDTQVFVINTKGDVVADPLYPELQGKNQIDLKSADGRPIQRHLVRMTETQDSGWLQGYLWPRPDGGKPGHKDIYVRRIQLGDQTLGVASGLYLD